jgi:hypothetical protein
MVLAMMNRLLCIIALVFTLTTACFADVLRVMSFNVRYPAKGDGKDGGRSDRTYSRGPSA